MNKKLHPNENPEKEKSKDEKGFFFRKIIQNNPNQNYNYYHSIIQPYHTNITLLQIPRFKKPIENVQEYLFNIFFSRKNKEKRSEKGERVSNWNYSSPCFF